MDLHFYQAYGLVLQSDRSIDIFPICAPQSPDVIIQRGRIDGLIAESQLNTSFANWSASENNLLLTIDDVARYLVRNGNEIWIEPAPDAEDADINAFLISSGLAALLQQRRYLTLHASAVMTEKGAVLFVGRSGIGKSTTLGALCRLGFTMVADDIAAITSDGTVKIVPGYPTIKLRGDAVRQFGYGAVGRELRLKVDKYAVAVESFAPDALPVARIFVLDRHDDPEIRIEPLDFSNAFKCLYDFTFRRRFYNGMGLRQLHFEALSNLVKSVDIRRIYRPNDFALIETLAGQIAGQLVTEPVVDHLMAD